MTATTTTTVAPALTDAKGKEIEVRYFVKTADLPKAEVTRLERKSNRVVLRDPETGKLFARRASKVTVLRSHGRPMRAKAPAKAKA